LDFRHEKWTVCFDDPPDDPRGNICIIVDQSISEIDDSTGSLHLLLQLGIEVDSPVQRLADNFELALNSGLQRPIALVVLV